MPRPRRARLARCFAPGDFYVELMHTLTPGLAALHRARSSTLAEQAAACRYVATNDVHYVEPRDFRLHDVLASAGACMALPGPYERPNAELYLKPAGEMRRLFADVPRACDATLEIAARCDLDLGLGEFHFPHVEVPRGETPYSVLSKLAWRGLEDRYRPMTPEAVRRLQHELGVIDDLGFSEYFLVVRDIVDFAKRARHPLLGTGERGRLDRHLRARHHRRRPDRATTCSSSASSTRTAARCPTSTSTSTRRGATRSSTTSTSASGASTWRWWRPSTR